MSFKDKQKNLIYCTLVEGTKSSMIHIVKLNWRINRMEFYNILEVLNCNTLERVNIWYNRSY